MGVTAYVVLGGIWTAKTGTGELSTAAGASQTPPYFRHFFYFSHYLPV